jgi:hypothetical protein
MAASHEPAAEPSALFPDLDETEVTRVLERDGIYCGLRLQSKIVQATYTFAETNPCFAMIDQNMPFLMRDHDKGERSLGRAALVGHYLGQSAAAMLVLHDPALYRIACRYLRAKILFPVDWCRCPQRSACLCSTKPRIAEIATSIHDSEIEA